MSTLTDTEKQIIKEIYPLLKDGKYQEAADYISDIAGDTPISEGPVAFNVICFLKYNGVDIIHKIKSMNSFLFSWSNLTEVTIPENIQSIDKAAFYYCEQLQKVTISSGIKEIGKSAFYNCCKLSEITIPYNVKKIDKEAFCGCTAMESVNIENGVQQICEHAFCGCKILPNITLPNSITELGGRVFELCDALETIYYDGTQEEWNAVNKHESWNGSGAITVSRSSGEILL